MDLESYLRETRYALEQLLANLEFYRTVYRDLYEAVRAHKSFVFDEEYNSAVDNPDYDAELQRYLSETSATQEQLHEALARTVGAEVSRNAISGAIIQIAFMGLKLHSKNDSVPPGWEAFHNQLKPNLAKSLRRFGVGRPLWAGVPLGLVVYAARNQYNHQDEAPANPLVIEVLARIRNCGREHLAFPDVPRFDDNPVGVASHLLELLGWHSYPQLSQDLIAAVAGEQQADGAGPVTSPC